MKKVYTWWSKNPRPGNCGDIITPVIFRKLFKIDAVFSHAPKKTSRKHIISTGSTISLTGKNSTVMGSGIMWEESKAHPNARYVFVRGPVSYENLTSNGIKIEKDYFIDPGLLVPQFFNPTVRKTHTVGITPHYVDYDAVKEMYKNNPEVKVINLLNANPLAPIKEIMSCKRIVSGSLHGLIFANAYGIKCSYVKYSDKLSGDGSKFKDYFGSVGVKALPPTELDGFIPESDLKKLRFTGIEKDIDYKRIINETSNELHKF